MRRRMLLALTAWMLWPAVAGAGEISGYVSVEGRAFFQDPLYPGQEDQNGSIAAQPEYSHQWSDGTHSFTFIPFGRIDSADSERTHVDIRELNYIYRHENWYTRIGIGKVFWGATEFVHLVDIVNQTDLIEHVDGEDKLGQPMLQFSITPTWGTVDFFILPYFRERTFPGRDGRLRASRIIDIDNPVYEAVSEENELSAALRYSRTFGDTDLGVYIFHGVNREPILVPSEILDPGTAERTLVPFYEKIDQIGLDAQRPDGNWLWKLEAFYRFGYLENYLAATGGFEYTFFGIGDTGTDLGLLAEYAYDGREEGGEALFDNDAFLGFRLTPNDEAGTQLLVGFDQDLDDEENALSIEGSRRFGSNWKLTLEAWFFLDDEPGTTINALRGDDFARLELAYYF